MFFHSVWEDDFVTKVDEAVYQIQLSASRQFCISLWRVAGALHSPKDMWSHLKKPRLPMVNAMYCYEDSSILICQNPDFRSRHEKWPAPTKLSNASWILSSGYESFFIWVLRHQKSMQKHRPPSFFWTNTTALHHMLWLRQIVPESNISHKCLWTSSTNGRGICLNHYWMEYHW